MITKQKLIELQSQGFKWIFKYPQPLKDGNKVRVFKHEPWFSIESMIGGNSGWVDIPSCTNGEEI